MSSMLPPPYGVAFEFDVVLFDADGAIKTTPTLAAGDFVLSKGNGATANLTTTPSESPASSGIVRVQLSATEMEADKLTVRWHDASGAEWLDGALVIFTAAQTFDTMDTNIDSILTDTGTDGVVLANDAITAAKFDESTAYPLKSADTGATAVARVGADGDTLETLSDQMDATAAAVADVPNNAEFEARTIPAAAYFDPAADTVANVTTVGSVTGAVGSVTGAVGSVTGNVGGNVAGSVGSVTGAVGSVTGNVGGNVTGSVGSVSAGGITAASIATDAIDADAIAADAVTEIQAGLATAVSIGALNNLSSAGAQAAAAAALTAYGAATGAQVTGLDIPTAIETADAVLSRGVAHVEDTAEDGSLAELLLGAFESAAVDTVWTIRKTSGGTFNVRTLTLDTDAEPVTGVADA